MGGTDEAAATEQRLQSSFGTSSSSISKQNILVNRQLDIPLLNTSQIQGQMRHFGQSFNADSSKRSGIPPSHPQSQIPPSSPYYQIPISRSPNQYIPSPNFTHAPSHSRSLSQPPFFSLDSLPPLSPCPSLYRTQPTSSSDQVSGDFPIEERDGSSNSCIHPPAFTQRIGESLPPRKLHRRSNSDIPFGFSTVVQSSQPIIPLKSSVSFDRPVSRESWETAKPVQLVKKEPNWDRGSDSSAEGTGEKKSEGEIADDLFSAYMNLDRIDALNSSGTEEKFNKNSEDVDSRTSGTKTYGGDSSDNEVESSVNDSGSSMQMKGDVSLNERREGIKRSVSGDVAPTSRHYRSVSMDSFMEKMQLGEESSKLPPSTGTCSGQPSPNSSMDGNSAPFSLEFGNGEFSGTELKKIMANEKLAEIALADPKRAKRILANRQSAARSKERKMRYISELEHKVQTLQTEATTLSTQLTLLQRDSGGLTNQNSELKFRLQAMEQQALLRDALNEALTAEVQRLKVATGEISSSSDALKGNMGQQQQQQPGHHPSVMFQLQHSSHLSNIHHQMQQQQKKCDAGMKHE